jgi:hypothetical protein
MRHRMRIATHESGHAVVARALGVQVIRATLDAVHTRHGAARHAAAIVAFAGPAAELRLMPMTPDHEAAKWGSAWAGDLKNCLRFLDAAGGLPCAPVRREAERLVDRCWRQIERVAAALAERGELSGAEVDEVIFTVGQ